MLQGAAVEDAPRGDGPHVSLAHPCIGGAVGRDDLQIIEPSCYGAGELEPACSASGDQMVDTGWEFRLALEHGQQSIDEMGDVGRHGPPVLDDGDAFPSVALGEEHLGEVALPSEGPFEKGAGADDPPWPVRMEMSRSHHGVFRGQFGPPVIGGGSGMVVRLPGAVWRIHAEHVIGADVDQHRIHMSCGFGDDGGAEDVRLPAFVPLFFRVRHGGESGAVDDTVWPCERDGFFRLR